MVKNGFISAAAAAARRSRAGQAPADRRKQNSVRYFTDWALPQLDTLIDETSEPIDVWTTLDPGMQAAADRAIARQCARRRAGRAGRASTATARCGRWSAARDYVDSIYNRATQAERQPGSAFKLFVYLAALESGMKPTDTIVDEPVTIDGWSPRNSTRTNFGPVTLREAFSRSINTISAKIGSQLGFSTIADMARRFGISDADLDLPVDGARDQRRPADRHDPRLRLGRATRGRGDALRDPQGGHRRRPPALPADEGDEERVLVAPWVAAEMTDLLQSAVLTGTGRAAQIGRPVAGKTGTTSSNKDGWFIGFSSGLTTGVWMGRDDARTVAGLQGGTAPARAFHDFMVVAVANRPVEQFETQVPMPDWQLTPEEEVFGDSAVDMNGMAPMVDENGNADRHCRRRAGLSAAASRWSGPTAPASPRQQELDQAFPPQQRPPQPISAPAASASRRSRQPDPLAPADSPEPRPDAA